MAPAGHSSRDAAPRATTSAESCRSAGRRQSGRASRETCSAADLKRLPSRSRRSSITSRPIISRSPTNDLNGGHMSRRIRYPATLLAWLAVAPTAALAQNVPPQFVVSGKAAEQIQDFTTINLATAEAIAQACQRLAAAEG